MVTATRVLGGEIRRKLGSATISAELRRGAAAGVAIFGAGVLVRTLSELGFARLMGPGDFGAYSYIFAWLTILAVAGGLGVPYAFVRFIPEYEVQKDYGRLRRLAHFGRVTTLASGVAVGALGAGAILALRPAGVGLSAIILGMATVPALALLTVESELARGFRRVVLAYLPLLVLRPLFTVAFAVVAVLASGHLSAQKGLGAGLGAVIVCMVLQHPRVRRLLAARPNDDHAGSANRSVSARRTQQREWLRVALPLLAINGLAAIALRADVIVVGIFRGSQDAGVYAVAARVALLSTFALEALNTIVAPTISKLFYAGEHTAVQRLVRNAARASFACALLVTVALEVAGPRSLTLFGSGYAGGMTALQLLLIGQLINASTGPVTYLMIAAGEQNQAALAQTASTGLFLLSAIPLTAAFGFMGTAIAVTLGRVLINCWMVVAAQRRLGVRSFVL